MPKPQDKPVKLHIPSIGCHVLDYGSFTKANAKAFMFPSALFSLPSSDPFYDYNADIVVGKGRGVSDENSYCRYAYTLCSDGFYTLYDGALDTYALLGEASTHHPNGTGVMYRSEVYWGVDYNGGVWESVVVDGMMVTLTMQSAGKMWCTYRDTRDPDSVTGEVFEIGPGTNTIALTNVYVKDTHTAQEVVSQDLLPDASASVSPPYTNTNPRKAFPINGRIDSSDLTVSVMCVSHIMYGEALDPNVIQEYYYGALDVSLSLEIFTSSQVVGDETIVTRHVAIDAPLSVLGPGELQDPNDTLNSRDVITAVEYTDDYDYPGRVAALKSNKDGVSFNWFEDETLKMVQTATTNLVCDGRVGTVVRKQVNVYGWDESDPPEWVVVDTEWNTVNETAPLEGDPLEEDTLQQIAVRTAPYVGTSTTTYSLVGSRKAGYAFIGGLRQFVTLKAATGKNSVTFTATVSLRVPLVQFNSSGTVTWQNYTFSGSTDAYRSGADYTAHKSAIDANLAAMPDETWDMTPTTEVMIAALVYDDGAELEGVDGENFVNGGGFSINYKTAGWSFAEYYRGTTFYTEAVPSVIDIKMTGADMRQPLYPKQGYLATCYLNLDDKLSCVYARMPGSYFGGTARPSTNEVLTGADITEVSGARMGFSQGRQGVTTLTVTQVQDSVRDSGEEIVAMHLVDPTGIHSGPILEVYEAGTQTFPQNSAGAEISQNNAAINTGTGTTSTVQHFEQTWTTLQQAFDNYASLAVGGVIPTAFIMNAVPYPGVYWLAGSGPHGDQGGTPRGWRQYNDTTGVWDIVWLDVGGATEPIIPSLNGARAFVQNTPLGLAYAGAAFVYIEDTTSWIIAGDKQNVSPTYTMAELIFSEDKGGLIANTSVVESKTVWFGVYQNGGIVYRVPVPGTDNFMYTVSSFRYGNVPDTTSLTRTFIGDAAGNVVEEVLDVLGFNDVNINIATIGQDSGGNHQELGLCILQ